MDRKNIILIKYKQNIHENPSLEIINQFETSIHEKQNLKIWYSFLYISKVFKLIFIKFRIPLPKFHYFKNSIVFSIQMGPDFGKSFPLWYLSKNLNLYFFDIWPEFYKDMDFFIKKSQVRNIFFSSSYTTKYFTNLGYKNVHWIPEGIKLDSYKYYPFQEKDIDVLELGRRHQPVHDQIKYSLKTNNKVHLYEISPGKIIFNSDRELVDGLARTKISICFPRSITNPVVAGPVNTMTSRYLQSMASKCLIVGTAPEEMIQLFGYNPVVEMNMTDPASQLIDILENFSNYDSLIEKNYKTLVNHTWECRWMDIYEIILR